MKSKTKIISITLFFSAHIMLVSYGNQEVEWKGKVEYKNGIKVIKNPQEPLYGEIKFELEEDLSIGKEDDENYMFYRIVDIALDTQNNIYVLEYGNKQIQKFNRNGQFLQTIGRRGQGPGEFGSPFQIFIDRSDNIYVSDNRKIKIFNKKGNSHKDIVLKNRIIDFSLNSEGIFMVKFRRPKEIGHICYFDKVDRNGKILKTIARFPYGLTQPKGGNINWVVTYPYIFDLFMASLNGNTFIYGYSKEYKISVVDENGRILFNFTKDEPYLRISEREKSERRKKHKNLPESLLKSVQFPSHRPFFNRIMCDNQARIYIMKMKSVLDNKYPLEIDIFSKDGYYLYKTEISLDPYEIKEGYLYTKMSSKEKGEELIKRFKIRNWNQIKEGV